MNNIYIKVSRKIENKNIFFIKYNFTFLPRLAVNCEYDYFLYSLALSKKSML